MVSRTSRILIAAVVASVVAVGLSRRTSAHEVNVHQLITDAALAYLAHPDPDSGADSGLAACNTTSMQQLFREAVEDEDSYTIFPNGFFLYHFLPRLDDTVNNVVQKRVFATCSSQQWGLLNNADKDCQQQSILDPTGMMMVDFNQFTFDDHAIAQLATTPDDPQKQAGLRKLGHLLHLLQDLTSPAHASNDAHPHIESPVIDPVYEAEAFALNLAFGDPSRFEVVNSEDSKKSGALPPNLTIPKIEEISSELNAFTTLQKRVSSKYLSEKAALQLGITTLTQNGYTLSLDGYVYDADLGLQAYLSPSGRFVINERVARDQFKDLAPLAIAYTAALIKFVHTHRGPVCEQTLEVSATGHGTVTSSADGFRPEGINSLNCLPNAVCQHSFPSGQDVTLTAIPNVGAKFLGWSAAECAGGSLTCKVTMNAVDKKEISATFSVGLTVNVSGPGSVSGPGISCGSVCSALFAPNTQVTLTATPAANATFTAWSGDCSGGASATVTMIGDRSCTAFFAASGPPLLLTGTLTATHVIADAGGWRGTGTFQAQPVLLTPGVFGGTAYYTEQTGASWPFNGAYECLCPPGSGITRTEIGPSIGVGGVFDAKTGQLTVVATIDTTWTNIFSPPYPSPHTESGRFTRQIRWVGVDDGSGNFDMSLLSPSGDLQLGGQIFTSGSLRPKSTVP